MLHSRLNGKKALLPCPTFGEYTRLFPDAVTYSDCVGISTKEIEEKAKDCDVIVFVNPNNPTGSLLDSQWIYDFAVKNAVKTIIIDESFIEFSQCCTMLELLEAKPLDNCIIIKSLSKSLGIPGTRLGYVYSCNAEFNAYVKASIPIWNLNSIAEYTLEIILKHHCDFRTKLKFCTFTEIRV